MSKRKQTEPNRRQKGGQILKRKKITDEAVIAALITQQSVREASKACGLSETQIYERMKNPDFNKLYQQARRDFLSGCIVNLQGQMLGSVSTMSAIMTNEANSPQVRLNAADTILRYALKLTDKVDILERVENLEKILEDSKNDN